MTTLTLVLARQSFESTHWGANSVYIHFLLLQFLWMYINTICAIVGQLKALSSNHECERGDPSSMSSVGCGCWLMCHRSDSGLIGLLPWLLIWILKLVSQHSVICPSNFAIFHCVITVFSNRLLSYSSHQIQIHCSTHCSRTIIYLYKNVGCPNHRGQIASSSVNQSGL